MKTYIKINNMVSAEGFPIPAGVVIDFGKIGCGDASANVDKRVLLQFLRLDHLLCPDDIELVSEAEYHKLFPNEG